MKILRLVKVKLNGEKPLFLEFMVYEFLLLIIALYFIYSHYFKIGFLGYIQRRMLAKVMGAVKLTAHIGKIKLSSIKRVVAKSQ